MSAIACLQQLALRELDARKIHTRGDTKRIALLPKGVVVLHLANGSVVCGAHHVGEDGVDVVTRAADGWV